MVLNVRQASEAERSVLIQGKWASAETMAQSGADFPERSEEYNALALKATEEAMALEEAEQIYLTELLVTHNGTEAEQFRHPSLTAGRFICLDVVVNLWRHRAQGNIGGNLPGIVCGC